MFQPCWQSCNAQLRVRRSWRITEAAISVRALGYGNMSPPPGRLIRLPPCQNPFQTACQQQGSRT